MDDFLKPKLLKVSYDTTKLSSLQLPDSDFDSDLEDTDASCANVTPTTEASTRMNPGSTDGVEDLFVIDKGSQGGDNEDKAMQVKVDPGSSLVKTRLSDVRPSLYISSGSSGQRIKDLNRQWAEDILRKKTALKEGCERERTVEVGKGKKAEKRDRKEERAKTAGGDWFNMARPELNDERKRDLEVLRMRKVLDTKTFYKKNDIETLPRFFQMGTVVDNATDFYSERLPRKMRKQTLVDELLQDEQFKTVNKKKYREALEKQQYTSKKAFLQLKKIKKKEDAKIRKRTA